MLPAEANPAFAKSAQRHDDSDRRREGGEDRGVCSEDGHPVGVGT
jgi:hypothetical protein